ncbi:transglycosylase SLT domain-containing protein [Jannaschia donghaensis]|uniref:Transglycosylase SLT domain protein n=1 Tax=Jannaschia donghaensis TaxID=420998 RepID=A0A0M6YN40_9RHOB|nr:transglycosylase SLT domain-containing protein [Jannaschia donghaensis]CTQ51350.1 Transglycosylase SLT domain protein [Jannaschia donghaensis]
MTNRSTRLTRVTAFATIFGLAAGVASADIRPTPEIAVPTTQSAALTTTLSTMSLATPRKSGLAPTTSALPRSRPQVQDLPDLRWDHIRGSSRWTAAAMRALDNHGERLVETVPRDIQQWCPAYADSGEWERKAFWAGLLSTLSKHESTYRPTAVGGGGLWYGLVQILPATARGYGCEARTGDALKDGALNMACAVRILNRTVPRDGVVSQGMRGVAADWGPFHSSRKREDMRRWLVSQPFCNGLHASMRPVERPEWLGEPAGAADEVPLFVSWELDKDFLTRTHPANFASDRVTAAPIDG